MATPLVHIRRLAVDRELFQRLLTVECPDDDFAAFRVSLESIEHDGLATVLAQARYLKLTGKAWRFIQPQEIASLDDSLHQFLAPVRNEACVACPQVEWGASDAELTFYDDDDKRVGKLVVDNDREFLEIAVASTGMTYDDDVAFDGVVRQAFEKLLDACRPTPEASTGALPAPKLSAWKVKPASPTARLPEWLTSMIMCWASLHLRIHVVPSAASELDEHYEGAAPKLFVNEARMQHYTTLRGATRRCCLFYLHDSTGGCVCKHHRVHNHASSGTHACTVLRLDFCGCNLDHTRRCPYHSTREPPPFQNDDVVASTVCTQGLSLRLDCKHNQIEDGAPVPAQPRSRNTKTTNIVNVPLESNACAVSLAAAAVALTEGTPSEAEVERLVTYANAAFSHAITTDEEERESIDMSMRDQMVESMLRSGELFYGFPESKSKGGVALRKRKHPGAVPKWMKQCMPTHGHLLPTK